MIFSKASEKKTVKARSKPSEYEAMLRNGFIMPKLNSTIVNKIYMYRVKSMQEYCPMTSDIKVYKICINPPSKDYLLCQIHEELVKKGDQRDLSYDDGHLPDVEWCVKALLALNPDHHIFDKDYVPGINEKGRKGYRFQPNVNEEDLYRFQDFDKGLPSYLHQLATSRSNAAQNFQQNARFTGRPFKSRNIQIDMDDDTLTDKDIQGQSNEAAGQHHPGGMYPGTVFGDETIQSENKMDIQEPENPFVKKYHKSMLNININSLQSRQRNSNGHVLSDRTSTQMQGLQDQIVPISCSLGLVADRVVGFDNLGQTQFQAQIQSKNSQQNLDLQSTLKQLNGQLFPSNISKNKSKKKLNNHEEEMIVNMFEKLVLNCKGKQVDFVKTYLDQYHSEKKSSIPSITLGPTNFQFGAFNQSQSNAPQMSKMHQVLLSPNKAKGYNFSQIKTQITHQFNSSEKQIPVNQFQCDSLQDIPEDTNQKNDIHMKANENENVNVNDDDQNFKDVLQTDFEGSSNYTTEFNKNNTDTAQSLNSFNNSQMPNQQRFNI